MNRIRCYLQPYNISFTPFISKNIKINALRYMLLMMMTNAILANVVLIIIILVKNWC
jgi:hypothetical protein